MHNAKREAQEIRRWLKKKLPKHVSGRYYSPIPPAVYAPMGGFRELDKRYRQWRREDERRENS